MQKNREKALSFAGEQDKPGKTKNRPWTVGTVEREAYMIKNVFERSRSHWVRYNRYELKQERMDVGTLHLPKVQSWMCITL